MVLMSCFISKMSLADVTETDSSFDLELKLELPTPLKIKGKNGTMYLGFSEASYKEVLALYSMYITLGDEYRANQSTIGLLNLRVQVNLERLLIKDALIDLLKKDREFIHDTWKLDREASLKEAKKQKIQIILFTSGGVAVGFILGLLGSLFL